MEQSRFNEQPVLCVRLKSWCDQWVSISELDNCSSFDTGHAHLDTAGEGDNTGHIAGSRQCQGSVLGRALIGCELEEESSCLLALRPRQDGKYDLQICDGGQGKGLGQGSGQGLFLGFVGRRVGLKERSGLDTAFTIQFGDNDSKSLCLTLSKATEDAAEGFLALSEPAQHNSLFFGNEFVELSESYQ